ncbi:MAG: S9 family peptidase [Porticoccaceae bacterium]|nr:MAG: S9 family peptidase [Porticoccaceae bacterium]
MPCGSWPSPITPELAASTAGAIDWPLADGDILYWIETRPTEGGRSAVVAQAPDGTRRDLLPAPLNVRSRVHEYGGRPYAVAEGVLYFVLQDDQRIYCLDTRRPDTRHSRAFPVAITPAERGLRFAEPGLDRRHNRLLAIGERHHPDTANGPKREPTNFIAAIALDGSGAVDELVSGDDFYAYPSLSPDGSQLAWISWNHPDMPWDRTHLWLADIGADGACRNVRHIAGGNAVCATGEAVLQPGWTASGELHFVSDRSGWWNLYRLTASGATVAVFPLAAEFATPLWSLGMSTWAACANGQLATAYTRNGLWRLGLVDPTTRTLKGIDTPHTEFAALAAAGNRVWCVAASPAHGSELLELDASSGAWRRLHQLGEPGLDPGFLPAPESFHYATEDGTEAHGFYYRPAHPRCTPLPGELPPLIALCHGGPTGATSTAYSAKVRFWTSRGFAVADFNYRGSTGYGRAYRDALRGRWGLADVADVVAGVRHLAARGRADPARLLIRGSSAGGYTVLAALTFADVFRAGASLYGIGDLEALARDTHKFESRYLDGLVGPWPAARERYRARSPIHHVAQLDCPVIFFQGLDDKVVPPNQTLAMVAALRARDLPVVYVPFPGEGHGFRKPEHVAQVFREELAFYQRVLGLERADA